MERDDILVNAKYLDIIY
jgi:hypothetical protein